MNQVMGIIHHAKRKESLEALVHTRSIEVVPFGGRYHLIDFALSNMVNTGIENVAILPQYEYRSVRDYLGSGKAWDLSRQNNGLFVLPAPSSIVHQGIELGNLHSLFHHLNYFNQESDSYVILSSCHVICNMKYKEALQFHKDKKANITLIYKRIPAHHPLGQLQRELVMNGSGRVSRLHEQFDISQERCRFLDSIIIDKSLFIKLVKDCMLDFECDFMEDILLKHLDLLKVYGYEYGGYVTFMDSVARYLQASLELLQPETWKALFHKQSTIYTKVRNDPPTRYMTRAKVHHSLIANGCVIEGTVENSIIFRGVKIHPRAMIKNSIIMPNSVIEENVKLNHVILDEEVHMRAHKELVGTVSDPIVVSRSRII